MGALGPVFPKAELGMGAGAAIGGGTRAGMAGTTAGPPDSTAAYCWCTCAGVEEG